MKRKNIAVLMTALDSDGQAETLRGIEACGKANGCNIAVFLWFTGAYEKERHNLGEINIALLPELALFDGVILFSDIMHDTTNRERLEKILAELTCPIVSIGFRYKQVPAVWSDNYAGMRSLMEHIVKKLGLRKIHFVKGIEGNLDAEERYRAYKDVLKENDIEIVPERITQGDFYVYGGEEAVKDILGSNLPFPEAIVCANDTMALTVCDILVDKGYHIPDDVIITGYDYSMECQMHYPPIISVRVQSLEMGRQACKVLFELWDGKQTEQDVMVPDYVILEETKDGAPFTDLPVAYRKNQYVMSQTHIRKMIQNMIMQEKNVMASSDYENWRDSFKQIIEQIDPAEFYYCSNQGFVERIFNSATLEQETMGMEECMAYSEEVDCLLAYKNGEFFEKPSFASNYALDNIFADEPEAKLYIFSPIHYLERNYGYVVFVESSFPKVNPLYILWLNFMGHSVENIRKQSMLRNAMTRLDDMYIRDSLTGVYNRFGLERYFKELKERCIGTGERLQLSFIDLDGLKKINDKFGHAEGDRVIRAIGLILENEAEEAYVIRYGGDEFVVIGPVSSETVVKQYWDRVLHAIEQYNAKHQGKAALSVSYGYNLIRMDENTRLEDCIQKADKRMYKEKNRKKGEIENAVY